MTPIREFQRLHRHHQMLWVWDTFTDVGMLDRWRQAQALNDRNFQEYMVLPDRDYDKPLSEIVLLSGRAKAFSNAGWWPVETSGIHKLSNLGLTVPPALPPGGFQVLAMDRLSRIREESLGGLGMTFWYLPNAKEFWRRPQLRPQLWFELEADAVHAQTAMNFRWVA